MSTDRSRVFLETIKRILVSIKSMPPEAAALADDANIIDDIGLDSIELLNFMLELEAQLDIQIDFERLELSSLHAISTLSGLLQTMPSAPAQGPA